VRVRLSLICAVALISFLWQPASGQPILDAKQPFVEGLIQLLDGIPGEFGDEGPRVVAGLTAMEAGLRAWDTATNEYRTGIEPQLAGAAPAQAAGLHVALGAVLLDRGHVDDAVRELTAATTLDPALAAAFRFRALAHQSAGNTERIAADVRAAWLLDRDNPVSAYLFLFFARAATDSKEADQATALLTTFQRQNADRSSGPAAPFLRVTLLEDSPGTSTFFPPARYARAFRELRSRQYATALTAFRDAWATDPLNADAALKTEAVQQAIVGLRSGQWPLAIAGLEAALPALAGSSEVHRLLGVLYSLDDQDDESVKQFEAAIALGPRDERSRLALADVYVRGKAPQNAERVLRETITVLPDSGQAHWRLAAVLDLLQRGADARRERELAIGLGPLAGQGRAFAAVAQSYMAEANLDRAVDSARAWVSSDLNNPSAHELLGQVYWKQGREREALTEFVVEALLDPSRAAAASAIAQIQLAAGRFAEAVEAARRALAGNPRDKEARYALANALLRSGNEKEGEEAGRAELAEAEKQQAEELARVRESYAVNLLRIEAALREQQGRSQDAATLRQQVVTRNPRNATDLASLGDTFAKSGNHEAAAAAYRDALALSPEPDVFRSIIREYQALGRTQEAADARTAYQRLKRERLLESPADR
jgi:tetratricopeptide (TPR) repeat protein